VFTLKHNSKYCSAINPFLSLCSLFRVQSTTVPDPDHTYNLPGPHFCISPRLDDVNSEDAAYRR
jgi:hypothetical protein